MPTQVVDVDLRSQTGAIAQDTFSDLIVFAREPTVSDVDYNEPNVYDSASQVASDFGEDSDAYEASREIERRGARQWWVVMLETTEHNNETVGNSDTEQVSEGELENAPLRGGVENVSAAKDGDDLEVQPVTSSPPEAPDEGSISINFDTGEVRTDLPSSGEDSGIVVSYETVGFDAAFPDLTPLGFDLAVLADTRADRSYIGSIDEIVAWADTEPVNASVVVAYDNGNNYETDEDAMAAAHDFGGYVASGRVLPIAHKSSDDVAAGVAGRLATKRPWFNPYMDGAANYSFSTDQYRPALIGDPGQPGTFEGGDNGQEGPTNVLHTEMGVQILSNSLSTAGEGSNYQYFDVSRTENFIVQETKRALRSLRLRNESIPFAPKGKALIENALRKTLNAYVSSAGRALSQEEIEQLRRDTDDADLEDAVFPQRRATDSEADVPLSELDIHVPDYDDLSRDDRANRVWSGIQITAQLAGNVHTFSVELLVQV